MLAILFFGSGVSALIYQLLWLRLLGLVFGVTTYAASTVWAGFMAGLALGSVAAGRLADRVHRPLVWFGSCELLIGGTALATPWALATLQRIYIRVYPLLPPSLAAMMFTRFVMAFTVLIVPTVLMGATLPLIVRSSIFHSTRLGERLALLYGMNAAGAIAGALAAGLYLIQAHGIRVTFVVGAAVNAAVGVGAILAGTNIRARSAAERSIDEGDSKASVPLAPRRLAVILVAFAISGFTSLALEVVWVRVLTLFIRPTVYALALMLAAILAGIAAGSCVMTPLLDRRARWIAVLAGLELAIAVAAVISFRTLTQFSAATAAVVPYLSQILDGSLVYPAVSSLLAIFPTALLMGMAFPVGLRLWTEAGPASGRTIAERVGVFYSTNVSGAIAGSLAAGFVLLPYLGSHASLIVLGTMGLLSGLCLLAVSELTAASRIAGALAAVLVFIVSASTSPDPFDQFVHDRYRDSRIVWQEEGVESTVVVLAAQNRDLILTVNGNHMAGTDAPQVNGHRSIGHLPMMLHPDARSALVIGLGGGATAGAVALHDGVDVDVVELSGSVVRAARRLGEAINYQLFSRPNVHLRVDDGRNFMLLTSRRYDVVTADIVYPGYAGSGNLYSAEYFQLVRHVLKPGGLAVQWCGGTDAEYKTIARTFMSVFPYVTAWRDGALLIGTEEPMRLRRQDFDRKLRLAGRAQGARDLEASTFDDLLAMYRAGNEELRSFVGPGPILTDDRPLVEYFLGLPDERDVDLSGLKGDVRRLVVD